MNKILIDPFLVVSSCRSETVSFVVQVIPSRGSDFTFVTDLCECRGAGMLFYCEKLILSF